MGRSHSILLRLVGAALALAAIMLLTHQGGDGLRHAFALENEAIRGGQVWRLATAHIVNLSLTHSVLNILGLGLILVALWSVIDAPMLMRAILFSGGTISLGWLILMPEGLRYVGFSGITHGVLAFGGLVMLRRGSKGFALVILACIVAKLGQELINGAVPGADAAIGGRVSFVSHTLGALGGVLAARDSPIRVRVPLVALCVALTLVQANRERVNAAATPLLPLAWHV